MKKNQIVAVALLPLGLYLVFDRYNAGVEWEPFETVAVIPSTASEAQAKIDIRALDKGVSAYLLQNQGRLPESLEELVLADINGNTYIEQTSVPKDPWGVEYCFETLGGSKYRIWTEGADKAPGGEGEDQDYDSETLKEK